MSKELTKEEILSARIGTYGFTKLELSKPIICPIEALDAMQEYSDQNTKPLVNKIAELKSQLLISEQKVKLNYNCAVEFESKLKASKSEANEVDLWKEVDRIFAKHKSESLNVLLKTFTITRNNK